jgi:5-methylthioadenosine/S-adenosylhomocysteine deaminase
LLTIDGVTAVTMDAGRRVITDAAIVVDGGVIVSVGKAGTAEGEHVDGRGLLALPGFIDAHAHADQSVLRGRTDDLAWIPFLDDWITPYLTRRDPAWAVAAYRLTMVEMIRSGTTCFVSPNVDPGDDLGRLTAAVEAFGVRAVLAHWVDGFDALEIASEAVRRWDGGLVSMRLGLDIPRLLTDPYRDGLYRRTAERATELGSGIVSHFCSEVEDWTYYEDHFGLRPTEWAEREGILGPSTLMINACWATAVEARILAATGTPVAHSPSANMKMASGVLAVRDLRDAGVTVALGTDGAANNNSYDMVREMKAACLLQNSTRRRFGTLTAEAALEMATIGGAVAIGRGGELGSLEAGKRADMVLVDLGQPHTWPVVDEVSNLVYSGHGGNVDSVMVDGRWLMRGRELVRIDEGAVLAEAAEVGAAVAALLPVRSPRWPRS